MFRIYDTKEKVWLKENIHLKPDGELVAVKRSIFGLFKMLIPLNQNRYICHRAIDLWDMNGVQVYEGDYVLARIDEDKTIVGLVVFAQELSSYIILSENSDEFFTLGNEVTEFIEVVGNVFDGYDGEESDGNKTL